MKIKLSIILTLFAFSTMTVKAQEYKYKKDDRKSVQIEDEHNFYNSEKMTSLDILEVLDMLGVNIMKFDIGTFAEKLTIRFVLDEYSEGKLVKSDTIYTIREVTNEYFYTIDKNEEEYFVDYINQIKIIAKKKEDNELKLLISTYQMKIPGTIKYEITEENQMFFLRHYSQTKWELNKKIPLFIYASSWKDKKYNFHRFCGVVDLSASDKDTKELLDNSPSYFIFNYLTEKPKK